MTWWQTLIVAAVPALLTLFLTRAFDAQRLAVERADKDLERWSDERKTAHIALLATLRKAYEALQDMDRKAVPGVHINPDYAQATDQCRVYVDVAREQVAAVELFGSQAASTRATQAVMALRMAFAGHRMFALEKDRSDDTKKERSRLLDASQAYLRAAREDIGTSRPSKQRRRLLPRLRKRGGSPTS